MTTMAEDVPAPRVIPRRLHAIDHRALLAAGDAVCAVLATVIALWLWSIPAGASFSLEFVVRKAPWFVGAVLWFLTGPLSATPPAVVFSIPRTLLAFGRGAALLLLTYLALYFYAPRGILPRLVVLYFLWESVLLTLAWRLVFIAVFSRQRFRQRALIVGSGAAAALALQVIREHRSPHIDVEAVVNDDPAAEHLAGVRAIDADAIAGTIAERDISEIVLALRKPPHGPLLQTLLACQEAGVEIVRVQTLVEQLQRKVPVDLLDPDWLMTELADARRLRDASWWGKRALDVVGGLAGLAVGLVLGPAIVLAIRLDSPGPAVFRQRRLGRGGVPFDMLKFRTMTRDAERPGHPRWAGTDDPRVTRVGRFLRRTRLDELPQVICVLRGDMSLVGPRPERAEFVERLQEEIPFYRARLMVPPGLTGWAQVNLPYGDSVELARRKLEYDLYYVKHRSFAFDLAVMARTIGTVLSLRGSR